MEISGTAPRALVEAVEALGFSPELLVEGLGVTVADLRDGRARISWDLFVALHDNLVKTFTTTESRLELGRAMAPVPVYASVQAIAAALVSPRSVYRFLTRWVGPSQFPHLRSSLVERDDGRFVLTLTLPPPYRECVPFLEICAGGISASTTLLGAPPAHVELAPETRGLRMTLTPPAVPPLHTRVAAAFRGLLDGPRLFAAFREHRTAVAEGRDRLFRSHGEFHDLIERMVDCVVLHREGRVVYVNRAGVRMLGYDGAHQLIGRTLVDVIHPDDRAVFRERMAHSAPSAELPTVNVQLLRRDGAPIHLEVSPAQVVDFDGRPARLVVGRDRTEQRRIQEQLMIAERMASLGVLAAGVAHEINNPLAFVKGSLELLAAELAVGDSSSAAREALGAARDGVERVRAIVLGLKAFSRIDRELGPVALDRLVGSTVALARKELELHARVVVPALPPLSVRGNAPQLGQVLLDLLLNAAESIPADSPPDRHEIRVEVRAVDPDLVALEVIDTGAGIAADVRARIFDPFFTTKPVGKGTGLGLSICHRIVHDLGGRIEVESEVGRGSLFRVVLPRAADQPEPVAPVSSVRGARARILLVDDEPQLRRTLALLLRDRHDVEVAVDGRDAYDRIAAGGSFDVVLCDLMMSEVDGAALYEQVAATRPGFERRFLFMTGGAFTARASAFIARVSNPCLEKPFEAEALFAAIDERLAAARDGSDGPLAAIR